MMYRLSASGYSVLILSLILQNFNSCNLDQNLAKNVLQSYPAAHQPRFTISGGWYSVITFGTAHLWHSVLTIKYSVLTIKYSVLTSG